MRTEDTLSHDVSVITCARCMRKITCEVFLSTLPVGCNGSVWTKRNQLQQKFFSSIWNLMSSFPVPFRLVPPWCAWRGMPSSVLILMDRLFNLFSWFVVQTIFHQDSGSKFRSKFHRPIFACFVQGEIPLSLASCLLLWSETICMVFLCKFIPLFALLFCPSDCELWFTINWISEKSIVNTCKMFTLRVDFLAASLPRIPGHMVLFLFFGLAMSSTMIRSFLYHVVRDRECIQSQFVKFYSDSLSTKICPQVQYTIPWFQKKETVRTLYFWKIWHNSKNSRLPIRGSSPSVFLLDGL